MNEIFLTKFGSQLYGTQTPTSDVDLKGIYIPTADDIIFQKIKGSVSTKRPKGEGEKNYAGEVDSEIYSLNQFFKLVGEGQTVVLDVLFSNPEAWVKSSPLWEEIVANRHRLLTRKSEAFVGYCRQQAKKYGIKGSRVAAARKVLDFLKRLNEAYDSHAKLGNFDHQIHYELDDLEFVEFPEQTMTSGTVVKFLEVCGRKLMYTASIKNALDVVQGLVDEYGHRAILAESNEGVDWKALSHAVRIGEQAVELFQTKEIIFPRPNAEYLRDIKLGKYPYKEVATRIEELFVEVEEAARLSDLPEKVDQEWINDFIKEVYGGVVSEQYFNDHWDVLA